MKTFIQFTHLFTFSLVAILTACESGPSTSEVDATGTPSSRSG